MARLLAVALALVLVAAGCGDDDEPVTADDPNGSEQPAGDETVHRGTATVLESPEHGPQLCGGTEDSYPPQCGGPDITNWDWDEVDSEESASGTTWGSFEVTGTWDAETRSFTLTETPGPPGEWQRSEVDFTSPCPEPAGGRVPVDPATTTDATLEEVQAVVAPSLPGYAGLWIDQSPNPAMANDADAEAAAIEGAANDPTLLVLNVLVTEDPVGAEAAIRKVWGGALCVSEASHTEAELRAIQEEIVEDFQADMVGAGVDTVRNRATFFTYVATDQLRDELEARYGDAVEIEALLHPVDD